MRWMQISTVGLAVILAAGGRLTSQEPPPGPSAGPKVLRDLPYVEGGHQRNRLDLYLPEKSAGPRPLVVWIHGGGWQGGSKEGCPVVGFVAQGYVAASINYRLSQHAVFPAQIEDCKAAIRWLRTHAAMYGIDPDRIGVWGASAGGHLVALLGTTGGVKELEGNGGHLDQSSRVQCVVDLLGPSDFLSWDPNFNPGVYTMITHLLGGPVPQNRDKARKASPLTYVDKNSAPFLIEHGDKDSLVPLEQSQLLASALKKAGVEVTLQVLPGSGHGGPAFTSPENRKLIVDFFAKHLHPGQAATKAKAQSTQKPRRVLVTISKETTYITEPLRPDGYVDYLGALNRRFSEGVTPENNAAVPFLKAMWPADIKPERRGEYCALLGVPRLADDGDYYLTVDKYAKRLPAGVLQAPEKPFDQLSLAMRRPWSKQEFPFLAAWLAANEKPINLLVEASERPLRYDPLISAADRSVLLVNMSVVLSYREAARALIARAMFRAGEAQIDRAWEDLLACHRLARLAGQGPMMVELMVGITVNTMASAADQALLQHASLTATQAARMRADLAHLPLQSKASEKVAVAERYLFLDSVAIAARVGPSAAATLDGGGHPRNMFQSLYDVMTRLAIDWDVVLRTGNPWYDRVVDIARKPARRARVQAMNDFVTDGRKMSAAAKRPISYSSFRHHPRRTVSERVGQILASLFLPAVTRVVDWEDCRAMQLDLVQVAFALAGYHADHASYPARLAELTPKYIAAVPKDVFNDADLHYRREARGYLLYSVGVNGKDDGGKTQEDALESDEPGNWADLVIRVPAKKRPEKQP